MLVEPDIATTGFPFNCSIVRMLSAFRAETASPTENANS